MMVPQVVSATAASFISGRCMTSMARSRSILLVAVSSNVLAFVVLAAVAWLQLGALPVALTVIVLGAGMGTTMPAMTVMVQNTVDQHQLGAATALLSFCRSLGAASGVALAGGIAGHWIHRVADVSDISALPPELVLAYRFGVGAILAASALMMFVSLLLVSRLPKGSSMAGSWAGHHK